MKTTLTEEQITQAYDNLTKAQSDLIDARAKLIELENLLADREVEAITEGEIIGSNDTQRNASMRLITAREITKVETQRQRVMGFEKELRLAENKVKEISKRIGLLALLQDSDRKED